MCLRLLFPTGEKSSEAIIFLDHTKCSFYLYGSVHTQLNSLRCMDPFGCFPFLSGKGLGQRYLSVLVFSLETLLPVRTSSTAFTDIVLFGGNITIVTFSMTVIGMDQFLSIRTGICVTFRIIWHVFHTIDILFELPGLSYLIIRRLDVCLLFVLF